MSEDAQLLKQFIDDHSEAAFTALVRRHIGMVHGAALRRLGGDAAMADDATQMVFVSLARKARSLRDHTTLAGWLYLAAHHATAELVRREQRRKQREFTAHTMQLADAGSDSNADAAHLRPLLDDALISLPAADREAIVLRFFAQNTFAEVGAALQLTEEAARKRVERSLDKLRTTLAQRGLTSTVAALGTTLTAVGSVTTPSGLSLQVATTALAQSTATGGILAALQTWFWPTLAAGALAAGAGFTLLPQREANAALRATLAADESASSGLAALRLENERLRRDLATLREPPPPAPAPPATARSFAPTPPAPAAARPSKAVRVDTKGALSWEGEPITLDEYLLLLKQHRITAPAGESAVVVNANDVRFLQLNWVLQETSNAGITNLVIESNAVPDDTFNKSAIFPTSWF